MIRIENLTGRYDRALVSLTGLIRPGNEHNLSSYSLSLHAGQVELNDDLIGFLPVSMKKIVSELQPTGKINFNVDLNKTESDNYPDYKLIVKCLGNSIDFQRLPYPLKDVTGSLTITKDNITLADITATTVDNIRQTTNTSTIKINGQIALTDNAFSSGWFQLSANDFFFDERLVLALPEGIQPFYRKLSPTGRFDLNLENIKIFNADNGEKYVDLAGTVKFKACNFDISPGITELDATLKTKGRYKTGDGFADTHAVLFADSLKIKGKSLTSLKANIYYDSGLQRWLTKNLIADCYSGTLTGRFELKQPPEPASEYMKYILQVGFENIDLKQFLSDSERNEVRSTTLSHPKTEENHDNGHTAGKMSGSLSISTTVGDSHSQIGTCRLQITDMQIGKLSPLAKLLRVLRLTEPKDYAFERMLVESYIKDNRLILEKFDLSGEAVAFNGSGHINLQTQDVDLILTARGDRIATAEPSILQSLTDALSTGVVRIEVTGNIYDPQVETKTLPLIKDTLQILGTPR